ncbi:MAG: SDR family oxidoreductase [Anaerolineales bacterium]|nr:SDR family oxidoreductase [Anaerolineales bacterium]
MSLDNRVAVITGATGSLGRVVAGKLAQAGVRLALFSLSQHHLDDLANELKLPADLYLTGALNFRNPQAAQKAHALTLDKFGRADILLNFIGGWTGGKPVVDVALDEFDDMLQQHLWTTLHLAQAFIPGFIAQGWGRLAVITSPSAALPPAKSAPYAVAKAAQETLILSLAQELKGSGVTANTLRVNTIDVKHTRLSEPSSANASWTTPEEIAEAILYLCSEAAGVINGARIPLYGSP